MCRTWGSRMRIPATSGEPYGVKTLSSSEDPTPEKNEKRHPAFPSPDLLRECGPKPFDWLTGMLSVRRKCGELCTDRHACDRHAAQRRHSNRTQQPGRHGLQV